MVGFRGVSIQSELINEIEEVIKKIPLYRSVAEFVSEAIRLRLEELRTQATADSTKSGGP